MKTVLPKLHHRTIVGDKIFASLPLKQQLAAQQVEIMTPVKLEKGQKWLDAADKRLSNYVRWVRNP